jgi:hypothetical protein
MKTGDELEDFFRKRLSGHEEEPPAGAWQGIKRDIPKRRPAIWWWLPVALLLLISVPALMYLPQFKAVTEQENAPVAERTTGTDVELIENEAASAKQRFTEPAIPNSSVQTERAGTNKNTAESNGQSEETAVGQEASPVSSGSHNQGLPVAVVSSDSTQPETIKEKPVIRKHPIVAGLLTQPSRPDLQLNPAGKPASSEVKNTSRNGGDTRSGKQTPAAGTTGSSVPVTALATKPELEIASELKAGKSEIQPGNSEVTAQNTQSRKGSAELMRPMPTELIVPAADSAMKAVAPLPLDSLPQVKANEPGQSAYSFGAYFSPRYTFLRFAPNTNDDQYIRVLSNKDHGNPQRFGYEAGVTIAKQVKRFELEASAVFSKLSESLEYQVTRGGVEAYQAVSNDSQSVTVNPVYDYDQRQYVSQYYYGGLKGGAAYTLLRAGGTRIRMTGGFGTNMLIKGITRIYQNGVWVETTEAPSAANPLRSANLNLYAGIGYAHSISPKVEVEVAPVLNYFLGSTYRKEQPFGLKPYTAGINVSFRLRK